jgi:hypothetical protein
MSEDGTTMAIQVVNEPHRALPFQVYAGPHLLAQCPSIEAVEDARRHNIFARLRIRLMAGVATEGAEPDGNR